MTYAARPFVEGMKGEVTLNRLLQNKKDESQNDGLHDNDSCLTGIWGYEGALVNQQSSS